MAQAEPKAKIKPKLNVKEPSKFKVIYVNDEVTTMEFVVDSLVIVFSYDEAAAFDITKQIHEVGSAVVAVLPYELAEQKGVEVTMLAREAGFPLAVKIEPDV
jgi:ATP-dependent Clp protease adaptor protein ClpS